MALFAIIILPLHAEVRPVPPPGIAVPASDRTELEQGLRKLGDALHRLEQNPLFADVAIYHKAVRYALEYNEIFQETETARAKELLAEGQRRADDLLQGRAPWTTATGLVVRGYVSRIDRSVQPYGLVVPVTYSPSLPHRWRLDTWFHGRNEKLSELNFIWDRERNPGEFTPPNTIVLHLYGRYCNANKLAGEIDLLESLDSVKSRYPVDENRIVVRGFSMGGAACWHIAAHHAGEWAAAAPGAGFSETPEFLRVWAKETLQPTWWEQKLWHLYDATDYAVNFYNCPVVAYNGEIDSQKQAADAMERAMEREGLRLCRIVGPNTGHKYHPDSKVEINRIIDAIASRGRDPYPRKISFTTWTLAYNKMKWLVVDRLERHWDRARLDAEVTNDHAVDVVSTNVAAFTIDMSPGGCPLDNTRRIELTVDGQRLEAPGPMTDRSWIVHLAKNGGHWTLVQTADDATLHKKHGLQGPIDDAFLSSFLFVRPTGTPLAPGIAGWVAAEQQHAVKAWRAQFRGDIPVRDDVQVSDSDIAGNNLVLWGDPGSNRILARIADRLPIRWTADAITAGKQRFPSSSSALLLIYPNPLNPRRYIVLNSGFTFREYDYLNNARQVPKLPDFAIVDITTPPNERYPGRMVTAGFFGENWQLPE